GDVPGSQLFPTRPSSDLAVRLRRGPAGGVAGPPGPLRRPLGAPGRRSGPAVSLSAARWWRLGGRRGPVLLLVLWLGVQAAPGAADRKSTRLNSSHVEISY